MVTESANRINIDTRGRGEQGATSESRLRDIGIILEVTKSSSSEKRAIVDVYTK